MSDFKCLNCSTRCSSSQEFCYNCLWRPREKFYCAKCYRECPVEGHSSCTEIEVDMEQESYFSALFNFGTLPGQVDWCYDAHLDRGNVTHTTPEFTTSHGPGTLTYGWNKDISSFARDRKDKGPKRRRPIAPQADDFLRTLIHVPSDATWTLNLPNGEYRVCVYLGDLCYSSSKAIRINDMTVDMPASKGITEAVDMVDVKDGTLTLRSTIDTKDKNSMPRLVGLSIIAKPVLSGFFLCHKSFMRGHLVKRRPKVVVHDDEMPEVVRVRDLPKVNKQRH